MAKKHKVTVEITAHVAGLLRGLKLASKDMKAFHGHAKTLKANLGSMIGGGLRSAGIAAGVATAAIGGTATVITKLALSTRDTQRSLAELRSLGIKDLDAIEEKARQFTNQWGGSKADFVSAAYDIKSALAELSDEAVGEYTAMAAKTAIATKANVGEMTNLFAIGYGIYKEQYAKMSDMDFGKMLSGGLSQAVQQFKTDGSKMSQAITALGASGVKAGQGMAEQLSVLGMLQRTMGGGEAGTAYAAFIQGASQAVKQGAKKLEKLDKAISKARDAGASEAEIKALEEERAGVDNLTKGFLKADGTLKSTADLLQAMRDKYGDVIDVAEKNEIKELFGRKEGIKVFELLVGQIDALKTNTATMSQTLGTGAVKTNEMAEAMKSLDMDANALGSTWQNLKEEAGDAFGPMVSEAIAALRGQFVSWQEDAKGWSASIKEWWGEHRDAIRGHVAEIVAAVSKFATEGVAKLKANWPEIRTQAEAAWAAIKSGAVQAGAALQTLWEKMGPLVMWIAEWVGKNPEKAVLILMLMKLGPLILPLAGMIGSLGSALMHLPLAAVAGALMKIVGFIGSSVAGMGATAMGGAGLAATLQLIGIFLAKIAAVAAIAFVGWKLGSLIGELLHIEEGITAIANKWQWLHDKMSGVEGGKEAVEQFGGTEQTSAERDAYMAKVMAARAANVGKAGHSSAAQAAAARGKTELAISVNVDGEKLAEATIPHLEKAVAEGRTALKTE